MRDSSESGLPAMRPLMLEYPDDPNVHGTDDQYMFGSDIMVAPVLREAVSERGVYLPKGTWFDFWTGRSYEGGRSHVVPVTMASIPLFVRAGAFLFRQPVVQHTGQMPGQPLTVEVYPADRSEAWLYEDDGRSLRYRRGESVRRRLAQARGSQSRTREVRVEIGAAEGAYRPAARTLEIAIVSAGEPRGVTLDGAALPRRDPDSEKAPAGWRLDERGFVVVTMPDRFEPAILVATY
jgi:alpha-glucosidase